MMFNILQLSKNIKTFRSAQGLSQTELANLLNISAQSVSKWECGTSVPDIENLCLLSNILNVSLDILLDNRNKRKKSMIGIDGGGSKTEFILFDEDGEILARTSLGACNPNSIGMEKCVALLKQGIDEMLLVTSDVCGIYVGSSGFLTNNNGWEIKKELNKCYPHIKIKCKTDLLNVLATATEVENCIIAICGTGSAVCVKEGEKFRLLTGWGYMFSKSGSGFDIGRDVLYSVLQEEEMLGEKTMMTEMVHSKLGKNVNESVADMYKNGQSYIASFVPIAFQACEKGDSIAKQILKENAERLAFVINSAYQNHHCGNVVVLSGGVVMNSKYFVNLIKEQLDKKLNLFVPECAQSVGACILCAEMCGVNSETFRNTIQKNYAEGKGSC